jgi:hypothetical protein
MPKVSDVYAGDYVTANELQSKGRVTAQITKAEVEVIGQDQTQKLVLSLQSRGGQPWPRRLVLNKTNGLILQSAYGDDTDAWLSRQIEIWSEPVQYQGRIVQGVRLAPATSTGNGATAVPATLPAAAPKAASGIIDDEIPF